MNHGKGEHNVDQSEIGATEIVVPARAPRTSLSRTRRVLTVEEERAVQAEFVDGQSKKALCVKYGLSFKKLVEVLMHGVDLEIAPAAAREISRERGVRIPRTSARSEIFGFAKLLKRVDAEAMNGFGFEGTLLRPGRTVPESSLWPTKQYPKIPVLLEYAGERMIRGAGRALDKKFRVYILWVWLPEGRQWIEKFRSQATETEWAFELRAIARRLLADSNGGQASVDVLPSLEAASKRISAFLTREFSELEPRDRLRLAGVLHDRLSAELAQNKLAQIEGGL